mgnify:FL=1
MLSKRDGSRVGFYDPPPKPCLAACRPHLYAEIYRLDPFLLVGLGQKAIEACLNRSFSLSKSRGQLQHVKIPGRGRLPHLTPQGKWGRKIHGAWSFPTLQNEATYALLPTHHPRDVQRYLGDKTAGGPFRDFWNDMEMVRRLWEARQQWTGP